MKMKLYHAAALALVGWYLMAAPPSFSGSGFGMSPLVVPGTADLDPGAPPAPHELSPAEQALYLAETKKHPGLSQLDKLADDPGVQVSYIGLGVEDNGEMVWHVGTARGLDGAVPSKVFEARIKAEFAKFSTKRVVVEPRGVARAL